MFNHTGPKRTPALNPLTERATESTPGNSITSAARDTVRPHTDTGSEEQTETPHHPAGRRIIPDLSKGFSLAQLSVTQGNTDWGFRKAPLTFLSPEEATSDRYFNTRFWTRERLRERHRRRQDSGWIGRWLRSRGIWLSEYNQIGRFAGVDLPCNAEKSEGDERETIRWRSNVVRQRRK